MVTRTLMLTPSLFRPRPVASEGVRCRDRQRPNALAGAIVSGRLARLSTDQPSWTAVDSRRSRDDLPTCSVNRPGGQTQPPAGESHRAKALAGTWSATSADAPGGTLTEANAASSRGGLGTSPVPGARSSVACGAAR